MTKLNKSQIKTENCDTFSFGFRWHEVEMFDNLLIASHQTDFIYIIVRAHNVRRFSYVDKSLLAKLASIIYRI